MPISFKLSNGAMVTQGQNLNSKGLATTFIHEMLHGFPGSDEVQLQQSRLIDKSVEFQKHYEELTNKWHSNPEEYFVVAAEVYLSEYLGIRTHDECIKYLSGINGGMPFSQKLYETLKGLDSDFGKDWRGYGNWLVENMKMRYSMYNLHIE